MSEGGPGTLILMAFIAWMVVLFLPEILKCLLVATITVFLYGAYSIFVMFQR